MTLIGPPLTNHLRSYDASWLLLLGSLGMNHIPRRLLLLVCTNTHNGVFLSFPLHLQNNVHLGITLAVVA